MTKKKDRYKSPKKHSFSDKASNFSDKPSTIESKSFGNMQKGFRKKPN